MPSNSAPAPGAARRGSLLVVFLTLVIDLVGFGIMMPILPNYASRLGANEVVIQMILASFSAMQFITVPIWGRLSDRIGRRPVILLSLIGSSGSYLLYAFAGSIGMLFASRIFAGICGGSIA